MKKTCKWCKKEFETNNPLQVYCSPECAETAKGKIYNLRRLIKRFADRNNFEIRNIDKIINAKLLCFGEGDIRRCPCDANNPERYCGSYTCEHDVNIVGHCHCGMLWKKHSDN